MDRKDSSRECPFQDRPCPVRETLEQLREEVRHLRDLSHRDPLTGLYNFRYLMQVLEDEMERTRRTGVPFSLIIADLDRFKQVNDTYGHEAGNRTLAHAARVWRRLLRRIDLLCRYGGEEFVIVLPGTRLGQATIAAERLRAGLEEHSAEIDGDRIRLSASFGVDCFFGTETLTSRGFLDRADQWLLKAKAEGRNRVRWDQRRLAAAPTEVSPEEREALFPASLSED